MEMFHHLKSNSPLNLTFISDPGCLPPQEPFKFSTWSTKTELRCLPYTSTEQWHAISLCLLSADMLLVHGIPCDRHGSRVLAFLILGGYF